MADVLTTSFFSSQAGRGRCVGARIWLVRVALNVSAETGGGF